ncbi:hypothetical protein ACN9OJ_11350, partial [Glaesserella parasuis]|uniref:hypothetical protein n=1 Tax=Glaesserella parasuis TaxID=738 RepID=UPI003B6711BF
MPHFITGTMGITQFMRLIHHDAIKQFSGQKIREFGCILVRNNYDSLAHVGLQKTWQAALIF